MNAVKETTPMDSIQSTCCQFTVGRLPERDTYCFACKRVHPHEHLDLRLLRGTLLVKVGDRHAINWAEVSRDTEKFESIKRDFFCQSLLTKLHALCPHGQPMFYRNTPLRIDICYVGDTCISNGLDFTTDLCAAEPSLLKDSTIPEQDTFIRSAEEAAERFPRDAVLRYDPLTVSFSLAGA